jgi:hypothetical protein
MGDTIREVQATLERCSDDVCVTVREHADGRRRLTRQAAAYVESGEWDRAAEAVQEVQGIVEGDVELLETSLEDAAAPEQSPSTERLRELTGAGPEGVAALYEYLAGEPVIGEQFTITVPDARLSGGDGDDILVGDYLTPRHLIDYVTGRADADGKVYSWGTARPASGGSGDCDDSGGPVRPGDVCGSPHLASAVSGPTATGGGLVSGRGSDGTVTVLNTPPSAEDGASVLVCPVDGEAYEPADLSEWGRAADGPPTELTHQGRVLDSLVSQVVVQPPGCPHAFPALLYVGRGLSEGQFVYTGGWVIDEAALFGDSVTALTMADAAEVVGVDVGDFDGDGFGDALVRSLSGERARRGARIDSESVDSLVESGVLSSGGVESVDHFVRKRPGRTGQDDGGVGDVVVTHVALDAPVLHLVDAGDASDEVKFKAGAELSGQVN